jgi:glycosyltransferase involved in cell wall biosynthesis
MLTADPELPVPPRLYGGIERIIALLAEGLASRGHDVTLVAHPASTARVRLVPYARPDSGLRSAAVNAVVIARAVRRHRPDLLHSFGRLASLMAIFPTSIPKIMSYQRAITPASITWGRRLGGDRVTFAACSERMLTGVRHLAPFRVIHNAVDVARYRFAPDVEPDAPLVFLGRIEEIKGPHIAADVARRAGRRLVLAGNVPAEHRGFFESRIRPLIDGYRVEYIGPVDDTQKSDLLSQAAALLMPILWEEPFGIVMAEALACGTPVIGFGRGAVPEVVAEGVTGFVRDTPDELVQAVARVGLLDRRACRASAEQRFSADVLVAAHEAMYRDALAGRIAIHPSDVPIAGAMAAEDRR